MKYFIPFSTLPIRRTAEAMLCCNNGRLATLNAGPATRNGHAAALKYCGLLLLFILAFVCRGAAQVADYTSNKEKIYLHTSHVFFQPGEELFFKLYLVNAQNNTPSLISTIAYVDVLGPSGNLVQKLVYPVMNGFAEGSYAFAPQAPGGIYKLRAYTSWMKNENDSTFFVKELTVQPVISPRILMKLDFPRKGYGPGDTVMADFSARNLSDRPLRSLNINYTVSIGGNTFRTSTLQTDTAGKAKVQFLLPTHLSTTDGLLNITAQHDSYKESIARSIPITLNRIDLQLMPEGGSLVAGLPATLAFKAVNEFGKPVDVKGEVQDGKGERICGLESFHNGMGKFSFTPNPGNSYKVIISSPANIAQHFPIPDAAPGGLSLQMSTENGRVQMQLHSTQQAPVKIMGYTKGKLYFSKNLRLKKGAQSIVIDPAAFPAGIARFTITQANGLPLAERVMFLNGRQMLQVSLTPDKTQYRPREKVTLKLKTSDEKGQPVLANFSLAVLDDKRWTFADDKQDHIASWLMMSSELRGKIEDPPFYFKKEEKKAPAALDLVMLTHGYRYFDYIPAVEQENKLRFLPDMQNIISGKVINGQNQPVTARVWLMSLYGNHDLVQLVTGEDGTFYFPGLMPDKDYFVVARSLKQRERVKLIITKDSISTIRKEMRAGKSEPAQPEAARPVPGSELNDVAVAALNPQRGRLPAAVVRIDEKDAAGMTVASQLPAARGGIEKTPEPATGDGKSITLRGISTATSDNGPLFIIDGVPVLIPIKDLNLDPQTVKSIYILKNASAAAVFGTMGQWGVVIVETKNPGDAASWNRKPAGYFNASLVEIKGPGITPVRRFYAPQYDSAAPAERTDFRETIYWDPLVETDSTGEATVSFYNSDATTTFRAIAEGIGLNGQVGRAETTYTAQNMLSLDAKIPPYLTVGDHALIPLHIKNNHAQPLHAVIKAEFTESVKAGIFNKTVDIAPGTSQLVFVPVTATSPVEGNIRFTVSSNLQTESISLPVTVVHKGFPVIQTFAGTGSASHAYFIRKMVPGSLQYELQLFKDPEGQLLDGIASMLREPHGCFEQTSSVTYPNIFILKYLRESGRARPDIESKAMEYLQKGYKKLAGYETAQGGFEWFGKTPPHEALTAYGLMEFTDMAEFIAVDQQMLKRTRAFLLGRRDGKGGFLLPGKGYDHFATVPNKIANIYIVYAFTHAGYGAEILPEYEHALAVALQSNDAYQLSMMALAASNLKRQKDFEQLMAILRRHYRQKTFRAATSVVNSKATSLEVETSSLYLLALARERTPDLTLMSGLLSRITAAKSYFGYSSTQATVLALNAVIEYAKARGKAAAEADISFTLNGRRITPGKVTLPDTPVPENTFGVQYGRNGNEVPYSMELSYYTFYPPDSPLAELRLQTSLGARKVKTGETVRMTVSVKNEKAALQGMSIARIGIPAGLSTQPWQLKELMEKNEVAYYEIFDNYLVLYWMGFEPNETKTLHLDLKADIPGNYKAKAGNAGLYYMPEHRHWAEGLEAEVLP